MADVDTSELCDNTRGWGVVRRGCVARGGVWDGSGGGMVLTHDVGMW